MKKKPFDSRQSSDLTKPSDGVRVQTDLNAISDTEDFPELPQTSPPKDSSHLSELEECILSALLGRELYGMQIIQAFEEASYGKRRLSVGTLYPLLHRLEQRRYVLSRMEEHTSGSRGGARRKYFKITQMGAQRLAESQSLRDRLYSWQPAMST